MSFPNQQETTLSPHYNFVCFPLSQPRLLSCTHATYTSVLHLATTRLQIASMSPHAVQRTPGSPRPGLDFNKFAVTRNAFLPEKSPVHVLSDPYYQPWEAVGQNLARLIDEGIIHNAIRQLPILAVDKLASEAEWRRAYTMLAFMTHAYVWGGDKPEEVCLGCFPCHWRHQEDGQKKKKGLVNI